METKRCGDGFWNESQESVVWLRYSGKMTNSLPSYEQLCYALIAFDKVFIEYSNPGKLADWLSRSTRLRELVRSDAVGLISDVFEENRLKQTEWLFEHRPKTYSLCLDKESKSLFVYFTTDILTREETDDISAVAFGGGDSLENYYIVDAYRCLKLSMQRGLTLSPGSDFFNVYRFMSDERELVRATAKSAAANGLGKMFGIPRPVTPSPDSVFEFRESQAHKEYVSYIATLSEQVKERSDLNSIGGLIYDQMIASFEKDMRKSGYRSLAETLICAGIDAVAHAPVGTAFAMAHAAREATRRNSATPKWKAFFTKWSRIHRAP